MEAVVGIPSTLGWGWEMSMAGKLVLCRREEWLDLLLSAWWSASPSAMSRSETMVAASAERVDWWVALLGDGLPFSLRRKFLKLDMGRDEDLARRGAGHC